MTLKNEIDKSIETLEKGAKNVKDAITEAGHRSSAEAERIKRDVAGDEMTTGEKVGSAANQAKEKILAEIDRAKRKARENT
jgi:hypothetical protein